MKWETPNSRRFHCIGIQKTPANRILEQSKSPFCRSICLPDLISLLFLYYILTIFSLFFSILLIFSNEAVDSLLGSSKFLWYNDKVFEGFRIFNVACIEPLFFGNNITLLLSTIIIKSK